MSRRLAALQGLRELPYASWREIDVADSLRFWALRMHDVGAIKSSSQNLIARCADLRFLNQLKKELKRGQVHSLRPFAGGIGAEKYDR